MQACIGNLQRSRTARDCRWQSVVADPIVSSKGLRPIKAIALATLTRD
jgi:hypothetical protein